MIETRSLRATVAIIEGLWERQLQRGVLLLGPSGVGKTEVLKRLKQMYEQRVETRLKVCEPLTDEQRGTQTKPESIREWLCLSRTGERGPSDLNGNKLHSSSTSMRRLLLLDGYDAYPQLLDCSKAWRPGDAIVVATNNENALRYMPNFFTPLHLKGMTEDECVALISSLDPNPPAPAVVRATAQVLLRVTEGFPGRILSAVEEACNPDRKVTATESVDQPHQHR